ncbi:AAA-domain-containing protein [Hysterangium stoloniferum]|nr:AAA-domain-containing protein [Hysterangium stoloniferum]
MTFLFQSDASRDVSVSVYVDHDGTDEAFLSQNIWDSLHPTSHGGRVAVSITSSYPRNISQRNSREQTASSLKSLTCWTRPSTAVSGISIPRQWIHLYSELFSTVSEDSDSSRSNLVSTHAISRVQPLILSEVIILDESQKSYHASGEDRGHLTSQLCASSRVFRQGSVLSVSAKAPPGMNGKDDHEKAFSNHALNDDLYHFRVLMTEPTLQGIADPDVTRFIVLPGLEDSQDCSDLENGDLSSSRDSETSSEFLSESDTEELVIGSSFLANTIVSRSTTSFTSLNGLHNHHIGIGNRTKSFSSSVESRHSTSSSSPLVLVADVLLAQIWHPSGNPLDNECSLFLRTSDLSKIGIFDGDWGVVGDASTSEMRLCRIFAQDSFLLSAPTQAVASPVLLTNLHASQWPTKPYLISVGPSIYGSHNPPIPVARAVTVARVASPYSNDRAYQTAFLYALKNYFDNKRRLVKKDDLIAVPIDAELASLEQGRHHGENQTADHADRTDDDSDLVHYSLPFLPKKNATGVVFFKITNIEYDVVDTKQDVASPDHYMAATMGELGCWVDTHITKMVQTGVEYSRVPDVASYLGLDSEVSSVPNASFTDSTKPYSKLRDLAEATLHPSAVDYELQLSVLLKGSRGIGKYTTALRVACSLGVHLLDVNCFSLIGETDVQTEGTLRARFEKAASCAPCVLFFRNIDALAKTTQVLETGKEPTIARALQECISDMGQHWKSTGFPVLVVATSSEPEHIPSTVLSSFKHEIIFEVPNETERLEILSNLLVDISLGPDVSLKTIATQTAAMVAADLVDLVSLAQSTALKRVTTYLAGQSVDERDIAEAGVMLTASDLEAALSAARLSYSESIGAPKIPNVSWDDVGGLASVKSDILDTIQLPLEHPELFADGLKKRSGILLYGPPGTGKTLLAKAVATSCSLNFFSVKGPELLNMYIGESEANVRRVFQRARNAKPCVIFFDELDAIAPKRGNHGDSGGVMDRIVSQLLAELDGMADGQSGADVFVIGATNRPDLLDPALLRPGRFDRMLYLGVSDTHEAQHNILQALTRKFRRDPDLDLMDIALQCPFNYTGADFYALCSDAMLKAMSRKAEEVELKIAALNKIPPPYQHPHPMTPQYYLAELADPSEIEVLVSRHDFESALRELVPSVSQDEMAHYAAVQRRFANDTINSDVNNAKRGNSQVLSAEPPPSNRDKGKGKAVI